MSVHSEENRNQTFYALENLPTVNPLNETKLSGSASTWYIAEQSGQQAIQVGFRRGTGRAPSIRVRPLTQPGQFGIGWDIAHDVGVGVIKAAALVRCTA